MSSDTGKNALKKSEMLFAFYKPAERHEKYLSTKKIFTFKV